MVCASTDHEEDAMTAPEQIPDTWDSDRDERFFRITARLLPSAVVEAASSLLASYDDELPLAAARITRSEPAEAASPRRVPSSAAGA